MYGRRTRRLDESQPEISIHEGYIYDFLTMVHPGILLQILPGSIKKAYAPVFVSWASVHSFSRFDAE